MVRLALHQFPYDMRAFLRNRQSRFFTMALPVLSLVIFASVFGGNHTVEVSGGRIDTSVYYVPGIITLGIIGASFVNLTRGAGFAGWDLLIVAAWGLGGLLVALRRFSWLPSGR